MAKVILLSVLLVSGAITATGFLVSTTLSKPDWDIMLCNDALIRRRAVEQDLSQLTEGGNFRYLHFAGYGIELGRLNGLLTNIHTDILTFCDSALLPEVRPPTLKE